MKRIKDALDINLREKLTKRILLYGRADQLHPKTREELTDCGVQVMDVPSKRKQESVDKRIIADIGLLAADLANAGKNRCLPTPHSFFFCVCVFFPNVCVFYLNCEIALLEKIIFACHIFFFCVWVGWKTN